MSKKIYISYTDIQNFLNDYFAQNRDCKIVCVRMNDSLNLFL